MHKHTCYICENKAESFMTFGPMPIANGFLMEGRFKDEYFFEMEVAFCSHCKMFQLINQPEPDHPLRGDLAEEYTRDKKKFMKNAEEFTKKHSEKRVFSFEGEDHVTRKS